MAQRVAYYSSATTNRGYIYTAPSDTSGRTQYEAGTALQILAREDGSVWMDGEFYRCTIGWAHFTLCASPTAVYETITDACAAPASVTLDTAAKILTVSGGAGGDLNAFTGYKAQYRQKAAAASAAWGAWTDLGTLTGGAETLSVAAPAGYARQFRACTTGAAGAAYYSAWVECATLLYGNTAPGTPAVSRPASGKTAVTATPTTVILCPAEPDGGTQKLQRSLDGDAWTDVQAVPAAGGTVYDTLPALSAGSRTVRYRLTDAHALSGGTASRTFTVSVPAWARTIAAGTVISSPTVSHRADITELLNAVNASRAWYGLAAVALPGTLGAFADWKEQMEALQAGLTAAYRAAGKAAPAWAAVPGYPAAAAINALRAGLV